MTDISLLVDVRDDIISLTKSIKKITDDLSNADRRDEYWSLMERLAIEGTKYPYEVQSLVVEAITLTMIPLALLTYKAPSLSECYRRWENNPGFRDELEKLMPKTSKLVRAVYHWSKKDSAVMKWWKMYQQSPSVLLHTPREVERDFQAKKTTSRCTETILCIEYYRSFQRGTRRPEGESPIPDAVLHLHMDLHKGPILEYARRHFGLESLAIITNRSEHRRIFLPGNEGRLSPVAIYDLTHQLRQPLRIFEPHVSPLTKAKRKVHESICNTTYVAFSLIMLLAGFPNQNINYLRISYGPTYASAYEHVGKITSQPRILLQTTLCLFMSLLFTMFMLLARFTVVPVGRMAAHGTLRVLQGAHYACSHTASIVQGFCGVTKAMLRKAPSFLMGTSQLIASLVSDVITDIANGQFGQRIATNPLYLIVPVAVWLLMAEYYSTRA